MTARLRRVGAGVLGLGLVVWSLAPLYNMLLIALDPDEGEIEFTGHVWPPEPSLESFRVVLTESERYLEHYWRQLGNSLVIGLATMGLTVAIAALASFAVARMGSRAAARLANASLLTYAIPAGFLAVPFHKVADVYGLTNNPLAVIAAYVAFATPVAILVLRHYAARIPMELDEAARIDGASTPAVFRRIYLPSMAPALVGVAIFALVVAWNDYVYQFVLLSSERHMTAAVMQAQLFDDADAPWNAMMAAAVIYAMPPFVIFLALRHWAARCR